MSSLLFEFACSQGAPLIVDREESVIRGVKVVGLESRNGRSYLPGALSKAAPLYEGAKVNVNHPRENPARPREYQDRIGTLKNPRMAEDGLFADLQFNPSHPLAGQLAWDAEHAPENVGLSHHVQARLARVNDRTVVEEITQVHAVDLVADPATTRGLFEGTRGSSAAGETADVVEGGPAAAGSPSLPAPAESVWESAGREALLARVRELEARFEACRRREEAQRELAEAALPAELVTPWFVEQLASAEPAARRAMIDDRRELAGRLLATPGRPRAVDQIVSEVGRALDAGGFARLVCRR
jgi:hypothetical protein